MLTRADFNRALLALPLAAGACAPSEQEVEMMTPGADLIARAAARRVVFAHQSVGHNILDGVRALGAEQGLAFNIVETRTPAEGPGIYHFMVGANEDPRGKIADFTTMISGAPEDVEVAVLKLCYIDFKADTDGESLARDYIAALTSLQGARPNTRFIAATAPLTSLPTGPKQFIKDLMGRRSPAPQENASRLAFNRLVRAGFDDANVFDIAKLEAGAPSADNVEYLRAALTDDGGHLNAQGQRLVAADLLTKLAS